MRDLLNITDLSPVYSVDSPAEFFSSVFGFADKLKLTHWHISGEGSFSKHLALDEYRKTILKVLDRLVETYQGNTEILEGIHIDGVTVPDDIIQCTKDFYSYVDRSRIIFSEKYTQSIIDDLQEAVSNMLYKLINLR